MQLIQFSIMTVEVRLRHGVSTKIRRGKRIDNGR